MDKAGRDLTEIKRRIVWLEFRGRSRMAEWLDLVEEFDRRDGFRGTRFRSAAEWLAFECQLTPRTARDHVRVARRLKQWPRVADALGTGLVSYSQVRALSRASIDENEVELLRIARTSSVRQLEQHVRSLRSAPSADLHVARAGHARRSLKWFWDDHDGSLSFFGRLSAPDGQAFIEAIETAAQLIHSEPFVDVGTGEVLETPVPLGARRADALAEIARSGAPRTQLVLHADAEALACSAENNDARGGEVCFLSDGPAIPPELARRLTCDCDVTLNDRLNLGRSQRVVSPGLRRALEHRDGRVCAMPGCDRSHGLHAHHIQHWSRGGRTDLDNLTLLCGQHHRLVHDDNWHIHRRRDGTTIITDPDGHTIHPFPARAAPGALIAA